MNVCLFEDAGWRRLLPLTWLHPVWELRCGALSMIARIKALDGVVAHRGHGRPWLAPAGAERIDLAAASNIEPGTFYLNARMIDVDALLREVGTPRQGFTLWNGEDLAAFCLDKTETILPAPEDIAGWAAELSVPRRTTEARLFSSWWDLLILNERTLRRDAARFPLGTCHGSIADGAHVLGDEAVYVAAHSSVETGAIIDARDGPVVVEADSVVGFNAVLKGPVYVGPHCRIKPFAQIGPNVSLGPHSRVAGEIGTTIFMGLSNKQHDGFLGHAYIGEWVNLGAGTTNSNLKNTYSNVKVWVDGAIEDSGQTFLGCVVGDHTKTAIGTVLNTGTVIGVACNVFGHGFPPRFIPSFSWGFTGERVNNLRVVLSTAANVMERRGRRLTDAESELLRTVFRLTETERSV